MSQTTENPHEFGEAILEQLQASRVNRFPFFAYTGIRDFVLSGEDTLMLKNIPSNPNKVTSVTIVYDYGRDSYKVYIYKDSESFLPVKNYIDIYFDQLADLIVEEMGIR